MRKVNAGRAMAAGFVATLVMTIIMYAAPMMGMPKMDIAAMLGSLLSTQPAVPGSGSWWMGMVMHFIDGSIIFSLIYAYWLYPALPGAPWVKGLVWGLILWFLAQAAVMPMMGMGFFSANAPQAQMAFVGSLIGHIIYGVLLGAIAGSQGRLYIPQREEEREHVSRP